jgi:hypothetical protein
LGGALGIMIALSANGFFVGFVLINGGRKISGGGFVDAKKAFGISVYFRASVAEHGGGARPG